MLKSNSRHNKSQPLSLFKELKRRNVIRVATAYVVAAWLIIQLVETILPAFGAGDNTIRIVVIVLGIAFVPILVFSWVFEITPAGLRKDVDVDSEHSITRSTGKKLDRSIMVLLALALGYFAFDKFVLDPVRDDQKFEMARQEARSEVMLESYGDKSIAVLPFVNMSEDAGNEYFSDGISEELLNLLARVPELRVISRSSAFSFKGQNIDIPTVATKLNVAHVLEGSVRKSGNQVRITVQLIEARSDTHLWSATYDRTLEDIFAVQDEIAEEVARELEIALMGKALPKARVTSPEALEAFLLGRRVGGSLNVEDLAVSIDHFQSAIDTDPGYVEAYVELAGHIYLYIMMKGPPLPVQQELKERARTAVQTALTLDSESAAAISMLGRMTVDHALKIHNYTRALELNPNHALSYLRLALVIRKEGKLEEAGDLLRKGLELDPLNANTRSELGFTLWNLGRDDEAISEIRKSIEIEPEMTQNHTWRGGRTEEETGRVDKAMPHYLKAYSLDPEFGLLAAFVARAFANLGAGSEAFNWLGHAVLQSPASDEVMNIAILVNWRFGDLDSAIKYAEQLLAMDNTDPNRLGTGAYMPHLLAQRDIGAGHPRLALERWQQAYPVLAAGNDLEINSLNFQAAMYFARILLQLGEVDRARRLLQLCLERSGEIYKWRESQLHWRQSMIYVLLKQKDQALRSLQREVEDGHYLFKIRYFLSWYDEPEFDFIRDEPEFQQLVQTIEANLAEQLEHVREMERNGEASLTPGVMIKP